MPSRLRKNGGERKRFGGKTDVFGPRFRARRADCGQGPAANPFVLVCPLLRIALAVCYANSAVVTLCRVREEVVRNSGFSAARGVSWYKAGRRTLRGHGCVFRGPAGRNSPRRHRGHGDPHEGAHHEGTKAQTPTTAAADERTGRTPDVNPRLRPIRAFVPLWSIPAAIRPGRTDGTADGRG